MKLLEAAPRSPRAAPSPLRIASLTSSPSRINAARVAAAFLELADLAGESVLFFFEPLDIRQGIPPLAVERDELIPVDLRAARRHARLHFVQILPQ